MRKIIIIGAGLAGLALAHGLTAKGFDAQVYERDAYPGARPQGYRIQLDAPGLDGLQQCLPADLYGIALATAGSPPPTATVRNANLEVLSTTRRERAQAFDRSTLRRVLLRGLEENVHYGATLIDYREQGDTVTARFADGRTVVGDVLIGADGVGSAVRRTLLPNAVVEDAGLRLIYGKIPIDAASSQRIPAWIFDNIFNVVTGGPGMPHLGAGPVLLGRHRSVDPVDDYLAVLVGAPVHHPLLPADFGRLDPPDLHALAGRLIDDNWAPALSDMLTLWQTETLIPLRISTAAPVPPWQPGRVTLMGDAIHAMSPALAMGANTALRDAGLLTHALSSSPSDIVDALSAYHHEMADYAFTQVDASQRIGRARVGQA